MQTAALRGECTATQAVCKRTFVISTFRCLDSHRWEWTHCRV